MKFELVEFYQVNHKTRLRLNKKAVGTLHIYCVDFEMDIRGIIVFKTGKKLYFQLPYFPAINNETGERFRYPHVSWTNPKVQEEMTRFFEIEVTPIIVKTLKESKIKCSEKDGE